MHYLQVNKNDISTEKKRSLKSIKQGFKELELLKKGKLK